MAFLLQFAIFLSNISVSATEEIDDIGDTKFIGFDQENMQTSYIIMDEPNNTYSSNIFHYDNFMESYFDNLTINHGSNVTGSCGYVGIDMLLSYYDTFLSDDIVPEEYDKISEGNCYNVIHRRNSPGSLFDEPNEFSDDYPEKEKQQMTSDEILQMTNEYYNYINQQKNISLHAKLITIEHSMGFYDYYNVYPTSTNHNEVKLTIQEYMSMMLNYSKGSQYQICDIVRDDNTGSDDVRNFVINKIHEGHPALVSVRDADGEGHWVIAYDYDETTDKIYCNFGWSGFATHITPENYIEEVGYTGDKYKNYTIYNTALTIEFNIPHKHSNNYAVTKTVDGQEVTNYYCYDSSEIEVYNLDFEISYPNPNTHKITYECGDILTGSHTYDNYYCCEEDESKHIGKCNVCGKEKQFPHILKYTFLNGSMHNVECYACGYNKDIIHNFMCDGVEGAIHYEKCSNCGYIKSQCTNAHYLSIDVDSHLMGCVDCEYTNTVTHIFAYGNYNSTQHEKYCIDCGYVHSRERHVLQLTGGVGNYKKCQICGTLVNVGGGVGDIFPVEPTKEKDPEEETK